jgi:hypothetical protein
VTDDSNEKATRQGKARQGKARQGKARQGKARQGKARQGKARQDKTGVHYSLCDVPESAMAPSHSFTKPSAAASSSSSRRSVREKVLGV